MVELELEEVDGLVSCVLPVVQDSCDGLYWDEDLPDNADETGDDDQTVDFAEEAVGAEGVDGFEQVQNGVNDRGVDGLRDDYFEDEGP